MGIQGLIPFLKSSSQNTNIRTFSGSTVAIDAYCWLHKGAFGCADKLAKGEPTDLYVVYCVKRVNILLSFGIKPIMVFDGQRLPSKADTEAKRRDNREKNRKNGKIFLQEGKLKEARECFQRCVDVTAEMAHKVAIACKEIGVDCIVAPYEADAQLAYLNLEGIANIIITEDSDLILFGCQKVFFKMDSEGNGVLFEKSKINLSLGLKAVNFTFEKFRYACIMSGCDYLSSLPGIGLVKAVKFFSLITNPDVKFALKKIPSYLKMPQLADLVTTEYIEGFIRANNTFLHQLVFCPLKKKLVPLNPYPNGLDPNSLDYAGKYFNSNLAFDIAVCKINYQTKKPFTAGLTFGENYNGLKKYKFESIWDKNYKPKNYISETIPDPVCTSTKGKILVANIDSNLLRNKSPKKRPLEVQNPIWEQDPAEENLQILKLYSSINDITQTKRRRTNTKDENEEIDETHSLKNSKIELDVNDKGVGTSQSSVDTTPKPNIFCIVNKSCEKSKGVSSRFFRKVPNKQSPCSFEGKSVFDEIENDSETLKTSVFDKNEIESSVTKRASVFDEIEKAASVLKKTSISDEIEKESITSKKLSDFDDIENENGTSVFDEIEREFAKPKIKENILTKLNKFAWKPQLDEHKPIINATEASRSSFKPPKIISKTLDVIELSDEETTKANSPPKKLTAPPIVKRSCRISGLSKKRKIEKINSTSRQLCLTDMLNNFRYKK